MSFINFLVFSLISTAAFASQNHLACEFEKVDGDWSLTWISRNVKEYDLNENFIPVTNLIWANENLEAGGYCYAVKNGYSGLTHLRVVKSSGLLNHPESSFDRNCETSDEHGMTNVVSEVLMPRGGVVKIYHDFDIPWRIESLQIIYITKQEEQVEDVVKKCQEFLRD